MIIKIITESDENYCETCGTNYGYGGLVYVDEKLVEKVPPDPACYDGENAHEEDLLLLALAHAGIKILVDGKPYRSPHTHIQDKLEQIYKEIEF